MSAAKEAEFLSLAATRAVVEKLLGTPISYWIVWRVVSDGTAPSTRIGMQYGIKRQDVPLVAAAVQKTIRRPRPAA